MSTQSSPGGKGWLAHSFSNGIPKRSFLAAVVVGTVLNAINQGDLLLAGAPLDVVKLVLTYLVPYCVATYGAVAHTLSTRQEG
jgi:hypothetical protein